MGQAGTELYIQPSAGASGYTGSNYNFAAPVIARYIQMYVTSNFVGLSTNNTGISQIGFYEAASLGSLPSGTAVSIAASAVLDLNGANQQVASLAGYGLLTNNCTSSDSVFTVGDSTSTTFYGSISDSGTAGSLALTKVGAGMLTLAGPCTYTGGTVISAGTLQVGSGGTTGNLPTRITNNSVLAFDRSDAITLGGVVSGSGSLVQAGLGTLNLVGTVSNSAIVGNAGQLVLTPSLVFSGNLATGSGGRIQNNSSLQFGNLDNSGIFLGGGSLLGNFVNEPTGSVRLTAGQSLFIQSASPQSNSGLIQAIGTQAAQASFEAAGPFTNNPGGSAIDRRPERYAQFR